MLKNTATIDPLWVDHLTCVLRGKYEYLGDGRWAYVGGREWHRREQNKYPMHPAVLAAFDIGRPVDWHQVVLEWPHMATDRTKLAFTQDDKKGEADRQTVTSIGKYLGRHWKCLADHTIRDIAARFTASGIEIWDTAEGIVKACQEGPRSCMHWSDDEIRNNNGHHPYDVYAPALGWRIAVRMDGGRIIGRALLHEADGRKVFVRTYLNENNESGAYSQRCSEMEAWLTGQGYSHEDGWPEGTPIAKVRTGRRDTGYMFPYLDGNNAHVNDCGDHFEITYSGEFQCDHTDGTANDESQQCPDCGARVSDDDMCSVGYHGDHAVCSSCYENDYTLVLGLRGHEYAVPNDDAVEVDGDYYDREYLSDNNIVELDNGEYTHQDNAFCCPVDECWYHTDDGVDTEDEGYCHENNTWECEESNNRYSDNTQSIELDDGRTVHPDHAPEENKEEETSCP